MCKAYKNLTVENEKLKIKLSTNWAEYELEKGKLNFKIGELEGKSNIL